MRVRRRIFTAAYTGSGTAALMYQVAWTRLLTLQLGHTVAAASTVLAAFMGGLALGAAFAGRLDRRDRAPGVQARRLRVYAALEIAIAGAALLLPFGLAAAVPLLAWAYQNGTAPALFATVRVASSLALVAIPAAAMGATFPIAAAWFAGRPAHGSSPAAEAGLLYAANTAGAAAGAIAAGFFIVPALGLRGTTWAAVALNLLAAAGALWLAAAPPGAIETASPEQADPMSRKNRATSSIARRHRTEPASPVLACAATAISGFVALVYEVAWTRLLALVLGPTTYAFATMAAAFVAGIAIGSAAGARVARRTRRPGVWLALMLIACAIAATTAAWAAAARGPLVVAGLVAAPDAAFGPIVFWQAIGTILLLLPMAMALGAAFTLALAVASGGSESVIGRDVARVYVANTIGAIAGALAGGFVLVPRLGLRATFQAAAILAVAGGGVCLAAALRTGGARAFRAAGMGAAFASAAAATLFVLPPWDRDLLASGAYKYAPYFAGGDLESVLRAGQLEYYKEGAAGTVSVRRLAGTRSMAIDGKVDASDAGDMLTQRLLGLLPALLHREPRDICVIGLGSGVTVGSALTTGTIRSADVVEISPEVVEASALFDRENGRPLAAPGVRLIVGDGRSHMQLTDRRYDLIVSEPSNPWMAGVAALFTREFFEAARARLAPDGLLCQWAHTYDISSADLRSIVRTFSSVFPQATMWLVGDSDLLLIGTNGDAILPHLDQIASAWRRGTAASALGEIGITGTSTPFALLSMLIAGPEGLQAYGGEAPIQIDDRMALEFSAPRGIYGRLGNENVAEIGRLAATPHPAVQAALDRATDADWVVRGNMALRAEAYVAAYDAFERAVAINPRNAEALEGLIRAAGKPEKLETARALLQGYADADAANVPARIALSRVLASAGDFRAAAVEADAALRIAPDDPRAAEQLASVLADAQDGERLLPLAEALLGRYPERADARYYRASALFLNGRIPEAIADARRLVAEHPDHARGYNLLGAACATDGQRDCARSAFESSIRLTPNDARGYVNLGLLLLESGLAGEAADRFAVALTIDPALAAAREGLARARAIAGL
ncbi:MAG: tetratricopeptide repeat protein [Acidobacteria bacterium]|nr:tetratricopeptide repeat protein [Acidobacteriota bacterium]